MRSNPTKRIEIYRVLRGPLASPLDSGPNGAFTGVVAPTGARLNIIASDGRDWCFGGLQGEPFEHVSVSTHVRCPTWEEMDWVKRVFWRDDETVMQLHVPRSSHINAHPYCLHLWRPLQSEIPLPPLETVAPAHMAGASG